MSHLSKIKLKKLGIIALSYCQFIDQIILQKKVYYLYRSKIRLKFSLLILEIWNYSVSTSQLYKIKLKNILSDSAFKTALSLLFISQKCLEFVLLMNEILNTCLVHLLIHEKLGYLSGMSVSETRSAVVMVCPLPIFRQTSKLLKHVVLGCHY